MSEPRPVPRRESPWGLPEGDKREPKAHRCNDRAEDVVQACFEGNPFKTVPGRSQRNRILTCSWILPRERKSRKSKHHPYRPQIVTATTAAHGWAWPASKQETVPSTVGRLEAGLAEARAAIRRASRTRNCTPADGGGFVPKGAVYRDAYAFHQSYIEMEKRFKVWAYREGEPPVVHKGIDVDAGGDIEAHLIAELTAGGGGCGRHRARHPGEAHAFFLPISVANIVSYIYRRDMIDFWDPQLRLVAGYVDGLAAVYPFWNRSRGADHFFVSCHEWAPILSAAKPELRENAIRVMCNADMSDGFDPATDVALPPAITGGRVSPAAPAERDRVAPERTLLAFFSGGGVAGAVGNALLARWEGDENDDGGGGVAASRRVVEAIVAGCVPVLVGGGGYSPPFSDVLDWRRFTVAVAAERVGEIKEILAGVSDRRYAVLRRRVLQVRRHFRVNRPAKRFDVVNMVIHSIWLRRLNLTLPY
uniref:Exostosin GT47 domain-containing protein n=1 Tax=Leersia perrieri TaxID=77586 RepID=A0A0D9WTA8_9ORYZ